MISTLLLLVVLGITGSVRAQNTTASCRSVCQEFYDLIEKSEACQANPNTMACMTDTCAASDTFVDCFPCFGIPKNLAESAQSLCRSSGLSGGGLGGGNSSATSSANSSSAAMPVPSAAASECYTQCKDLENMLTENESCTSNPGSTTCLRAICQVSSTLRPCASCLGVSGDNIRALEQRCASFNAGGASNSSSSSADVSSSPAASSESSTSPSSTPSTVPFGRVGSAQASSSSPSGASAAAAAFSTSAASSASSSPSPSAEPSRSGAQRLASSFGGAVFAIGLAALL